jgi:DNA-binding LacI/PurR family transcriptional regulator
VLNDSPSVSEATRQKVLSVIDSLDYSPNLAARRLSRGKTMALGVIVPFFTNSSVVKRLQGVVSVFSDSAYDLVLFDVEKTKNPDVMLRNIIRRGLIDGLLIISLRPADDDVAEVLEADLPTVIIDADHRWLSRIVVDNVAGAKQATQHLLDLGHRRISYINDDPTNQFNGAPTRDRHEGYRQALREADIPYRPEYYREGTLNRSSARHLTRKLLQLPEPPTAIFAYSDTQAIGVLEAANEMGIRVPEKLSVVGYDDIEAAELVHLTTIRQSLFESGVRGAQLLLKQMVKPFPEPQEILLETELVVRDTTAPPI